MIRLILILSALLISIAGFSQSYLGKTKKEVKEIAAKVYDEVDVISESETSFKMNCDGEVTEFFLMNDVCVKFNALKSYKCDCLASDIKAYNENLQSIGNMKWVSKDSSKLYEIFLNNKDYTISISAKTEDLAVLTSK
jgi:hypothetical protein